MSASNRLFTLKNIACGRGGRRLFQNLSFSLGAGDVIHLSGPNGTGKTSLLRVLAGALPAEGAILWEDKGFLENGIEAHALRFSFLPADDRALKLLETGSENLLFWARLRGVNNAGVALKKSLDAFGLGDIADRAVKYYSAGQRRRLSLARLLLAPAPLWLLDEPLNGLDAPSSTLFRHALEMHLAAGGMAVIASHHPIDPPREGSLRRVQLGQEVAA